MTDVSLFPLCLPRGTYIFVATGMGAQVWGRRDAYFPWIDDMINALSVT